MGWEEYNIKVSWLTPDDIRRKYNEYNETLRSKGNTPFACYKRNCKNATAIYPTLEGEYMVTHEGIFTNSKNKTILRYNKLGRILNE